MAATSKSIMKRFAQNVCVKAFCIHNVSSMMNTGLKVTGQRCYNPLKKDVEEQEMCLKCTQTTCHV